MAAAQHLTAGTPVTLGSWQPMAVFTATYTHLAPTEILMSRRESSSLVGSHSATP